MNRLLPFLISVLLISPSGKAQDQTLTLTINNIKSLRGEIYVAIYNDEKTYMNEEKAFKKMVLPVEGSPVQKRLIGLPKGKYAIAVYHDENQDGECNSFLGISSEPYGFSNNAEGSWPEPPGFEKTSFSYNGGDKDIDIKLLH